MLTEKATAVAADIERFSLTHAPQPKRTFCEWVKKHPCAVPRYVAAMLLSIAVELLSVPFWNRLNQNILEIVPSDDFAEQRDLKESSKLAKVVPEPSENKADAKPPKQSDENNYFKYFYFSRAMVYFVQVGGFLAALGIVLWGIVALLRYD